MWIEVDTSAAKHDLVSHTPLRLYAFFSWNSKRAAYHYIKIGEKEGPRGG
jgi:hypothetical protein